MSYTINNIHDSNDFFKNYKLNDTLIKSSSKEFIIKYQNIPEFTVNIPINNVKIYSLNALFMIMLINIETLKPFISYYKEYFNSAYLKLMMQNILFSNIIKEDSETNILNLELKPSFKNLTFEDNNNVSFKIFTNIPNFNYIKIYIKDKNEKIEITSEQFKTDYEKYKNIQFTFNLSEIEIHLKSNLIKYKQDKIISEIVLFN